MAIRDIQFEKYLAEEVRKLKGVYYPVKSSFLRRILFVSLPMRKIHPNPDDEFCFPNVGPNYGIISKYERDIRLRRDKRYMDISVSALEPIIVERIHPDGYMIQNGHHRWAATMRVGLKRMPVFVVNLTQEMDIRRMLRSSEHDKRVTLDLDEVVFADGKEAPLEKALGFPYNRAFRQRIRLGVPALFRYLAKEGYDIWVYTANFYSFEYIRTLLQKYRAPVCGIITGTARKARVNPEKRKSIETMFTDKYSVTMHIDMDAVVCSYSGGRPFQEFRLSGDAGTWSAEIMNIVKGLKEHE